MGKSWRGKTMLRLHDLIPIGAAFWGLLTLAFPALAGPPEAEPTAPQLKEFQDAISQLGGTYLTIKKVHFASLPRTTRDADLKKLARVPFPFGIALQGRRITDAGLKELANLEHLTTLSLSTPRVTDGGLRQLQNCKKLTGLYLSGEHITDKTLEELKGLNQITHLEISFSGFERNKESLTGVRRW
jgi:Leucine-rich repeat (LRR) protein